MPDRELSVVLARRQVFRGEWSRIARLKNGDRDWALIASPDVLDAMAPPSRHAFDHVEVLAGANDAEWRESAFALAGTTAVSRVVTNDEYCVELAGELRERFGLPGPLTRACRAYTDKVEMKARAAEHGVRVPRFCESYATGTELRRLVEELRGSIGGPVVVKPVRGAQSREVILLSDGEAVSGVEWDAWSGGPYEVEEFIAGDVFFCDALVTEDGEVTPLMFGEYLNPPLAFAKGKPHGSISLPFDDPVARELWAQGALVLDALPAVPGTVTHSEFIRARDTHEWVFLESAARAPGAFVARSGEVVVGVNLEELHLATQLGLPSSAPAPSGRHAAWVWYRRRPGRIRELREPRLTASAELQWAVAPGDELDELPMAGNAEAHAALTVFLHGDYEAVRADFESLRSFEPLAMG